MGFWETKDKIIIGDEYADELENWLDKGWKKLKKAYPKVSKNQFAATVEFIVGRYKNKGGD